MRKAYPRRPDKIRKIQETYEKWWLGRTLKSVEGQEANGKVLSIKYVGNALMGTVVIITDTGNEYCISGNYRPRKYDVELKKEIL